MLKIADIRAYAVCVPLLHPFKAAYGTRDSADFVVVEIEDNEGRIGLGEASTIPIYDEGSQAGVVYVLQKHLKPLLKGRDPRSIEENMFLVGKAVKGERYLKSALDFALHDLAGKIYGIPVCQLLGGTLHPIPVCWVLSAKDAGEIKVEAACKLKEGFTVFKLKVGVDTKIDLSNLEALRETVGESEIRLDGNEAWRPKEALEQIRLFNLYRPSHLEQPVPARDLEGLRFVARHSPIPVSADEVALTAADCINLARFGAADRVNIKLSRCGGYVEGRRMISIAEAANQQPFLGSMLELGLGTAASAHFAAAVSGMEFLATELVGPLLLKEDILVQPLNYRDGCLHLPHGPGLGVELNREALAEFLI
ncbi:MAG: enolase C-terminal domain-like protein [Bacillota bacterium]